VFDETNGSQEEQVDLNHVDDEEAPCDDLQRMSKIQVNKCKVIPQVIPLHPHKGLIKIMKKIKINMKMNTMIKSKRRATIKGEMRMIGIRKKTTQELNHLIQGCATACKEIIP
jgi:hypothetical protein